MTDADKGMNPLHFGNDPADTWIRIRYSCGYLPGHRSSPPFDHYQIILFGHTVMTESEQHDNLPRLVT